MGFYHGLPASKVAFSDDGSLLIVAFGTKLTLWDPDTNALQKVLGHNDGKEIRSVFVIQLAEFLGKILKKKKKNLIFKIE